MGELYRGGAKGPPRTVFVCPRCGRRFTSRRAYLRHILEGYRG